MSISILFVDDDKAFCEWVSTSLSRRGLQTVWQTDSSAVLGLLAAQPFDVVVVDVNMPRLGGLDLCKRIVESRPDVPVVVITAFGNLETAVAAIRAGAYDFITKPVKMDALAVTLARAVQHRSLREEVKRLRQLAGETERFEDLVGDS